MKKSVVQYVEKYKKNIAIDMRKRGFSYSEIQNHLNVPKSTLSSWLKNLSLTPAQVERLKKKRSEIARANSEKRLTATVETIAAIRTASAKVIREISPRELWLMGVMLYWRERFAHENESDMKNGVRFTSSDPSLIQLFLRWLFEVGRLSREEIVFDIFLQDATIRGEAIVYWARVSGYPPESFSHIYIQKPRKRKTKKKISTKAKFGLLRIRVRASSMLARQISGWIRGIQAKLCMSSEYNEH